MGTLIRSQMKMPMPNHFRTSAFSMDHSRPPVKVTPGTFLLIPRSVDQRADLRLAGDAELIEHVAHVGFYRLG